MCSAEIILLLIVALFHLEDPPALEITFELLGGETVILSLNVVSILLVFVHLTKCLVQGCLDLVRGTVYPNVTHPFILLKLLIKISFIPLQVASQLYRRKGRVRRGFVGIGVQFIIQSMLKQQKKKIRYKDLPVHLQKKYKNSIIFEKENQISDSKFDFNLQKLKERKAEKEKTIEEKLEEFKINSTEEKYLLKVFEQLSAKYGHKYFTAEEIKDTFKKMGIRMGKTQIQRMIWEFDEDLNKKITEKEFINMYKKCTIDKNSAQSKNLFHLAQFLMYCKPNCYKITVEDTLELLFVRAKIEVEKSNIKAEEKEIIRKLEQEIDVIFEGEEKTSQGLEKEITFEQYLQRINKRAIQKRRRQIQKVKSVLKYGSNLQQ